MGREEDFYALEIFTTETGAQIHGLGLMLGTLMHEPEHADGHLAVGNECRRLLGLITGNAGTLGLEHLLMAAECASFLLDLVQGRQQTLAPQHCSLLVEFCQVVEQGLPLVWLEKNDACLGSSIFALCTAIVQTFRAFDAMGPAHEAVSVIPQVVPSVLAHEIEQLLTTVEQEFILWEFITADHQRVRRLCRLLQRLRLRFALCGCVEMEQLSGALETTLNRFAQGGLFQIEHPEYVFLRGIDLLREALLNHAATGDVSAPGLARYQSMMQGVIRQPLGELLIAAGLVSSQAVDLALERQRSLEGETRRRLGEVLVAMGKVTPEQVRSALREQGEWKFLAEFSGGTTNSCDSPRCSPQPLGLDKAFLVSVERGNLQAMITLIHQLAAELIPGDQVNVVRELHLRAQRCQREMRFLGST